MRQKHKVQSPESNPGAVHVLTIPTIPPKPVVELTADEYEGAKKAMELIFGAPYFEESFSLVSPAPIQQIRRDPFRNHAASPGSPIRSRWRIDSGLSGAHQAYQVGTCRARNAR